MKKYSVKQLANLAGVSVRTLHYYDAQGLLKPNYRSEKNYRYYEEKELLTLQQILFYKELDFPLKEIKVIINDPNFDVLTALQNHKIALKGRQKRIATLLKTIDKTIFHVKKEKIMLTNDELYEGLPKDTAKKYRKEAIKNWGKETIEHSETHLKKKSKADFEELKNRFKMIGEHLFAIKSDDPAAANVQSIIKEHFTCICKFWGKKPTASAYSGLGHLYLHDERYTMQNGEPQPEYAEFLAKAMQYFSETQLS